MRIASLACALLWAAVIYWLSDQPGIDTEPLFRHQDKLFHVVVYSILGVFCMGALARSASGYRVRQLWAVTAVTGLYGILDEFHQSFVPGRFATAGDAVADISGGFLGALLVYLLARRFAAGRGARPAH